MRFHKYHGAGNDYIVLDSRDWPESLTPDFIRALCDRHRGVGSDGVLWGPGPTSCADFSLRIFNPDGSEAEKSGNGLAIFSRFLEDQALSDGRLFSIETPGGVVESEVLEDGKRVSLCVGTARIEEGVDLEVDGEVISGHVVDVGNPHFVVFREDVTGERCRILGPRIEHHPLFPRRTNVQFVRVENRNSLHIQIWERGAGYTMSSGTSATAAAAAAQWLDLADDVVTVRSPGGEHVVAVDSDGRMRLTATVQKVAEGEISVELLSSSSHADLSSVP